MPSAALLLLAGGLLLLLLVPARQLQRAGWTPRAMLVYLGAMLLLGLLVAELRVPARFLVPIFVIGYVAPFVTVRGGLERIGLGRKGDSPDVRVERPPTKWVSGPSRDLPGATPPGDESPAASGETRAANGDEELGPQAGNEAASEDARSEVAYDDGARESGQTSRTE